jgi:fructokinase
MAQNSVFGLIEAGGTKFVLGIASGPEAIQATARIRTTNPVETIDAAIAWFADQDVTLAGIGIAAFGPLDLDPASPTWGHITRTTKPGWDWSDLAGRFGKGLSVPVAIDTDVNGAALAEYRWGAGQGQRASVYLTIGTGIGGGAVIDGQILRGLSHPEMGHLRLPRHPDDRKFAGICPFHGDCLEGLASGPAIKARWGPSLSDLSDDHPGHAIIAHYLAQMAVTLQSIFEPGRIIMGGGVMATPGLLSRVQAEAVLLGKGYFVGKAEEVICSPGLGGEAGLLGALALAEGIASDG